jgi:ankyrin repeat protein
MQRGLLTALVAASLAILAFQVYRLGPERVLGWKPHAPSAQNLDNGDELLTPDEFEAMINDLPRELSPPDLSGDLDALDAEGKTRLIQAAEDGNLRAVERLLEAGADPNRAGEKGSVPLEPAVGSSWREASEVLGALLRDSALECAVRSGSIPTVEMLLGAGASPAGLDLKESLPEEEGPCDAMTAFLSGRGLLE